MKKITQKEIVYYASTTPRSRIIFFIALICFLVFAGRFFQLQILNYDHYTVQANAKHSKEDEITARRGEIYAQDYATGENFLLATNTSYQKLFIDPTEIAENLSDDPDKISTPLEIVEALTPYLFDAEEYRDQQCSEDVKCTESKVRLCEGDTANCDYDYVERMTHYVFKEPEDCEALLLPDLTEEEKLEKTEEEVADYTQKQKDAVTAKYECDQRNIELEETQGKIYTENEELLALLKKSENDLKEDFMVEFLDKIKEKDVEYVSLSSETDYATAQKIRSLNLAGIYVETADCIEPELPEQEKICEMQTNAETGEEEEVCNLPEPTCSPYNPELCESVAQCDEIDGGYFWNEGCHLCEEPNSFVWANPTLVTDTISEASQLADLVGWDPARLEKMLTPRKNRYVLFDKELTFEESEAISDLEIAGVGLETHHRRYYPEGELAAEVLGFVNNEGVGQYGLEGYFNAELEGEAGVISANRDRMGRILQMDNSKIIDASDGDTLVLTIDRTIQKEAERLLKEQVDNAQADSGEMVVMDPQTGNLMALAEYPSFDPNSYGDVYEMEELYTTYPEKHTTIVYDENGQKIPYYELANYEGKKYIYKNQTGSGVYKLKTILDTYEPGSTFKSIITASALNAGVVSPQDTYNDAGPIEVDEYLIHNAEGEYYGLVSVVDILKYSLNTGMSWIAQQMGEALMYDYITKFGFGERTDIDFEGEEEGTLEYYRQWATSEFYTKSFGQGLTVTPIQMAVAYSAMANGGLILEPHIVAETIKSDGTIEKNEPNIIRRAITEETSRLISSMLVTSVRTGVAKNAKIDGYLVAGKTGTSQIACTDSTRCTPGLYETGIGYSIASFAGYAPADDAKFVVIVKIDRPRVTEWGATNAAQVFKKMVEFLLDYFNIPPDEETTTMQIVR